MYESVGVVVTDVAAIYDAEPYAWRQGLAS